MEKVVSSATDKARKAYNSAADHYDGEALSFWSKYGKTTIERLELSKGAIVLDVACGSGASALPAARLVGSQGKVIAVDLAENLLQLGRQKANDLGLSNIEFLSGDMTALKYPGGSFDAVVCVFGIFFVPDMQHLVRELWRMVKLGGKLAVTTWGPRLFSPVYDAWREAVKAERADLYSAFNPWDSITEVASVKDLFLSSGVNTCTVVAENGLHPLHTAGDWWKIVMGSGFRWTIDTMGEQAALAVRNQTLSWIEENNVKAIETNVIYAVATKGS
jgi:ubiquinone/menaquinone biosynthesis C-methylase UbiE